jgi:hypothetical protein
MRDWMFSSVMIGPRPANTGASMPSKDSIAGCDRMVSSRHPSSRCAFGGVVQAVLAGEAAGQHHAPDPVGAQRIDRHGRGERAESMPPDSPSTTPGKRLRFT